MWSVPAGSTGREAEMRLRTRPGTKDTSKRFSAGPINSRMERSKFSLSPLANHRRPCNGAQGRGPQKYRRQADAWAETQSAVPAEGARFPDCAVRYKHFTRAIRLPGPPMLGCSRVILSPRRDLFVRRPIY